MCHTTWPRYNTIGAFRCGRMYCVYEEKLYERPPFVVSRRCKLNLSESSEFTGCDVLADVFRNGGARIGLWTTKKKLYRQVVNPDTSRHLCRLIRVEFNHKVRMWHFYIESQKENKQSLVSIFTLAYQRHLCVLMQLPLVRQAFSVHDFTRSIWRSHA